ncbi:MAG: lipase maturation factor family protein [Polyangiales bacterium]
MVGRVTSVPINDVGWCRRKAAFLWVLLVALGGGGALGCAPSANSGEEIALGAPIATNGVTNAESLTDGMRAFEGTVWDWSEAARFEKPASFVDYDLGQSEPIAAVYAQGDNNDVFVVSVSDDGESFTEATRLPAVGGQGLRSRSTNVQGAKGGRYVRVSALGGDPYVTLSELKLYRALPSVWPPRVAVDWNNTRELPLAALAITTLFAVVVFIVFFAWKNRRLGRPTLPLFDRVFGIDPRTLGVTRIAMALLLLFDLGKRFLDLNLWYTESSLLPTSVVVASPIRPHSYSILYYLESPTAVAIAFAFIAIVYLCFLFGIFTRVAHLLSLVALVSLQVRVDLLSNGGDFVFCALMTWTLFLPMGGRFSVDAMRRGPTMYPVRSLAVLALTTQLAIIYFFNAIHKGGQTWIDGTSVYYLAHQDRMVTTVGVWMRDHLPLWMFEAMSYGTLVIEWALPLLILSPWGRPATRRLAIVLIVILHGSIALVSNVGLFSPVMMVFSLLLITHEDWASVSAAARFEDTTQSAFSNSESSRVLVGLREATVALLIVLAVSQALVENHALKSVISIRQPKWMEHAVSYLRLNQGWKMFSPSAPLGDSWIVVDAITKDGRHVDPYNEVGSRIADPSLTSIPERLSQNYFFFDHMDRIENRQPYQKAFEDWILRYHERTLNPDDEIVSYNVYEITDRSPTPAERGPQDVRERVLKRSTPKQP